MTTEVLHGSGGKSDFLGESHLVNGEWVRDSFKLTPQERSVYRAFGRFFKKIRAGNKIKEDLAQEKRG